MDLLDRLGLPARIARFPDLLELQDRQGLLDLLVRSGPLEQRARPAPLEQPDPQGPQEVVALSRWQWPPSIPRRPTAH